MTCATKKSALINTRSLKRKRIKYATLKIITGYLVSETILWKGDIRARQDWFHHVGRVMRSTDLSGRAVLDL
jgi:hypothetical protein